MNKRTCPDCGCPIDNERVCPDCGYPVEHPLGDTPVINKETQVIKNKSRQGNSKKWWIMGLIALVVIGGISGGAYWNHLKTVERAKAEREIAIQRRDSIARIEREIAIRREDSIKKVNFIDEFVDVKVFVERTYDSNRWECIGFKEDIKSRLKELGYRATSTDYEARKVEGGDTERVKITTYEKRWDGEESDLWSKVVEDDLYGYIIYFSNEANRERFLDSCRDFGYTRKLILDYNGTPYLAVPINESNPNYEEMYGFGHCLIYLYDDHIEISYGGV